MKRREALVSLFKIAGGLSLAQLMGCKNGSTTPSNPGNPTTTNKFLVEIRYIRKDITMPEALYRMPDASLYQGQVNYIGDVGFVRSNDYDFSGPVRLIHGDGLEENETGSSYYLYANDSSRWIIAEAGSGVVGDRFIVTVKDLNGNKLSEKELVNVKPNTIPNCDDPGPSARMVEFRISHSGQIIEP